jgi:hypothetical protein
MDLISHAELDAIDLLPEPSAVASTISNGGVSILIQEMVVCGMMTWPCTAATIAAKRDDICRYGTRTGRSRSRKIAIRSTFLRPEDTCCHEQNLLPKQAVAGSSPVPRSTKTEQSIPFLPPWTPRPIHRDQPVPRTIPHSPEYAAQAECGPGV